ncbi:MAG TPA: hypothetical protein VMD06_01095 [Steroidobacteraceae bacterium]|nr:hypothetical protein [Steroidobacteraceae bacterium]
MPGSRRISSPLCYLSMAAVATILAGCATTPQATSAAASAETPESASNLVATADFTKQAQDDGWTPEVRSGRVLYCKDEAPLGSRFPERTCLDKAAVQSMMLAEERQREQMRQSTQAPGLPQ